ncbi:hypothetical protein ACFCV3_17825 [Kribbella sp. NPDC056345]|uniref:hypothetical protein n=1 Tax=Kribbella sp. NPDC056345 TaxID=3345789 RepID=UPI0035DAAC31
MFVINRRAAAAATVAVLLAVAGCGTDTRSAETTTPTGTPTYPTDSQPTVVSLPQSGPCDQPERKCRTLLSAPPSSGNSTIGEFKADSQSEHWVYLNCRGKKSVVVEIAPEPTFEIPCGDDWPGVTETQNQFEAGALKDMVHRIGVKAPAGVEWSLSVVAS